MRMTRQSDLDDALVRLRAADRRLDAIHSLTGPPALRKLEPGFAGLAAIVTGQQLSTASAAAIWGRLSAAFQPFNPLALHRARADRLRRLGLSSAKIRTFRALTREIAAGALDLDSLANAGIDEARRTLTALHGIGSWTADLYLLFCLGHADAWPSGDLALREATRLMLQQSERPDVRDMEAIAEPWRPFRGAAAHLLWAYYRAVRSNPASSRSGK
jgi:DNA-3-methyladenine glycosylase II